MPENRHPITSFENLLGSQTFFSFRLFQLLVDKHLINHGEAAWVAVQTANDIRNGNQDESVAAAGEALAQKYEKVAVWLLGQTAPEH